MTAPTAALALCLSLSLPCVLAAQGSVSLSVFPDPGQLFPRDAQDQALVAAEGTVDVLGWNQIHLACFLGSQLYSSDSQSLSYSGGVAPFQLEAPIQAGLVNYTVQLWLENGGGYSKQAESLYVVCGDAFLIQGQSNAVAEDYHLEDLANTFQSPWVRSFGTAAKSPAKVSNDLKWRLADGETGNESGSVGGWGLYLGNLLTATAGVPIAILNGAVGGTTISYHQRRDGDPLNLNSNYGRLLFRSNAAGLTAGVKAIFWYQGESDAFPGGAGAYPAAFAELYDDWNQDFPALEKVYLMQVRRGCLFRSPHILEVQRQLPSSHPKLTLMSTTAMPGHDDCHYFFTGYQTLGGHLAAQVARDFYQSTQLQEIDPPNVESAYFSSPGLDQITLELVDPDDAVHFDPGAEADFYLEDLVAVTSGIVTGNLIVLQLAGPTASATVSYRAHPGDGPWIANARGVGLLAFQTAIQ